MTNAPRTVTAGGNVLHQRTQRGFLNSLGLWPLLLPVAAVLFMATLPPVSPYFDTGITFLLMLACAWRVFNASRRMVVALGDNHLQYIGMGREWYFYYRDLDGVDLADEMGALSLPLPTRTSKPEAIPRYLVFTLRNRRRVSVRLSWFDGAALLGDLDARLPERVKRGERYQTAMQNLSSQSPEEEAP